MSAEHRRAVLVPTRRQVSGRGGARRLGALSRAVLRPTTLCLTTLGLTTLCLARLCGAVLDGQRASAAPPALPPLVQTCPMHPDIVESTAGTCPLCRMNLVPARLDASWMCPVHAAVLEPAGGACRLCGRALVPVTVSLAWTCRGDINTEHLEPGVCRDGLPRLVKRTLRPHGNHNPRHGGQFFMAPDNWHHIEGVYPRARRFRLHVYDDYARGLAGADLQRIAGRVVTEERPDPATRTTREIGAVPLRVARDGLSLEADLPAAAWPVKLAAKIIFKPGEAEYRFDFTFAAISVDPAPAPSTRRSPRSPSSARAPVSPRAQSMAADTSAADAARSVPAPATMPDIVAAMHDARGEIATRIQAGDFAAIWVPAFKARDLALALEPHLGHLRDDTRASAELALFRLVQMAWQLDAVGDTGNRAEIDAAFGEFNEALSAVGVAFAARP